MRARKNATASSGVGASGTSMRSTLDGRCENTIVFSRPKRSANQPAASSDAPERMPTQKKMTARSATGRPHRRKNQYDTIDWTTSAPANASRPKSAESFATVPALLWTPMKRRSPSTCARSTLAESVTKMSRFRTPIAA